jgi:hypothetical protein
MTRKKTRYADLSNKNAGGENNNEHVDRKNKRKIYVNKKSNIRTSDSLFVVENEFKKINDDFNKKIKIVYQEIDLNEDKEDNEFQSKIEESFSEILNHYFQSNENLLNLLDKEKNKISEKTFKSEEKKIFELFSKNVLEIYHKLDSLKEKSQELKLNNDQKEKKSEEYLINFDKIVKNCRDLLSKYHNIPRNLQMFYIFSSLSTMIAAKKYEIVIEWRHCYPKGSADQWSYKAIVKRLIDDNSSFWCRVFERGKSCIANARSDMEREVFKEYFGHGEDRNRDYTGLLKTYKNYFIDAFKQYCDNTRRLKPVREFDYLPYDTGLIKIFEPCSGGPALRALFPDGQEVCTGYPNLIKSIVGNSTFEKYFWEKDFNRVKRDVDVDNFNLTAFLNSTIGNITDISNINDISDNKYDDQRIFGDKNSIHVSPAEFAWWSASMVGLGVSLMLLTQCCSCYCKYYSQKRACTENNGFAPVRVQEMKVLNSRRNQAADNQDQIHEETIENDTMANLISNDVPQNYFQYLNGLLSYNPFGKTASSERI